MPGGKTHMPQLHESIKKHVCHANPSWMESRCWATAVRAVAKGCATGDVNFPGKQNMNAVSKARYCAAYAEWKANHPKGSGLGPAKKVG